MNCFKKKKKKKRKRTGIQIIHNAMLVGTGYRNSAINMRLIEGSFVFIQVTCVSLTMILFPPNSQNTLYICLKTASSHLQRQQSPETTVLSVILLPLFFLQSPLCTFRKQSTLALYSLLKKEGALQLHLCSGFPLLKQKD